MSTKSKRRMARRAAIAQGPSTSMGPNAGRKVAGQIVGELLNAMTFGALAPPSARSPESQASTPHPA